MKIICFECQQEIGEKAPFEDPSETHTICHECVKKVLIRAGKQNLRRRFIKTFRNGVSLRFDPEVDSMGVE